MERARRTWNEESRVFEILASVFLDEGFRFEWEDLGSLSIRELGETRKRAVDEVLDSDSLYERARKS